ncbi:hypothetical protein [Halobacteriovorax marinus]|uniref:hypothetical protein n=1 Tax=Halobacteriovorax marinus TaxID=97084 RepID=UPI003A92E1CF
MFRSILLSLLLLSCLLNIALFFQINKEQKEGPVLAQQQGTTELKSYNVEPSKIYFLGDYCRISEKVELFTFKGSSFEVWNRVSSSIEKTKSLKPNAIGKWGIKSSSKGVFYLEFTDEGEELGEYAVDLVTVGITGKVLRFTTGEDKLLYDIRNCF